jgi:TonB family protein
MTRIAGRLLVSAFRAAYALPLTMAVSGFAALSAQEPAPPVCGRVVAVSCTGPSSSVKLLLALPSANINATAVIPAEQRSLFGSRVEDRFDQRHVCVAPASPVPVSNQPLLVRAPDQLVVTGDAQPTRSLPNDVYRTCDPDVQLPITLREVHAQFTSDAMRAKVNGRVVLQGIVDRDGAIRDVLVLQPLEPSLDAEAQRAFAQWVFRPATHMGQSVAMAITVEMVFTLR